ncbi:PglZ domain-containing protein [Burkholderia cenocepacia]|uniref:PglZ domain-containing protein n=1 Tax=Burkholderia cenocepacia TaxID=95486 RepID=A0ABD4UP56_9BURK|nr:PglZ domain-containing protein [Burkholderia cenocepacia]MCW3699887.1 PglZ domain-containing protein [Burkholderia cenocepacia]MCW3707548.1 PglZ domain-containing protein [Burkholderia cenocepacia]MCW3715814.1 PglZ domain-containing protein [Burkholderia cenocepacia]MCW3723872.1 PglZ domain-containing protein [Burkholderia cenocepacia]MCW3733254.1 PglZ domain-containing protein [Burkholderia cenocepacia]
MHPLHDYVAKQLADKLKSRRVVVWYDERGEFQSFIEELRGDPRIMSDPAPVDVGGTKARLAKYAGSMFELRSMVEPLVSSDAPRAVIVYMPNVARDRHASVLMELEKAGTTWEPQLKQLAKNVLLQKYTLGIVDEMLPFDRKVSYQDLARVAAGDSDAEPPSILKSIFYDASGNDALLAAWLVSDARDSEIVSKEATRELTKLAKARLGIELQPDAPLAKLRAISLRYVLAGEFRLDLACDPPSSLDSVPKPTSKDDESAVCELARQLRTRFPDAYAAIADRVEDELGLNNAMLPPNELGAIDTFRFEERALLRHAGDLISNSRFEEALGLIAEREQSFWIDRDVNRKAQWEATRRMAELGHVALEVRNAVNKTSGDAAAWLDAYVSKDGWFRLDQAQRRMEVWVANLDEEPEERPLGVVRRAHEDTCHAMAVGFTKALVKAGWTVPGALHQTHIWSEVVADRPKPVAYILVDAMRFEMGVELAERLPRSSEVTVRAAVGALPSITPIGMAALQPGASASFSVIEQSGKLGARIDDSFLPDLASRKKHTAARVPNLVDVALDELLSLQASKLAKKLDGAQIVVVRSQEIDHAGETGFTFQARQVMDTVIDNLARAISKLAAGGIEHVVVSADHGHLFFAIDRDESMRTDAPGGNTVELHRRCWIGRGGATPPGCVRVSASSLGYASDLEFVFPAASGVFKAGGDLAFHHGGPSLQEMVIPVLTVRTKTREVTRSSVGPIEAAGLPNAVTNRIFSVTFTYGDKQMLLGATSIQVRPLLMAAGRQVGAVGMAVDAKFDRVTGIVELEPSKPVTIAFLLSDESAASLRVVVQDPATDAELYRSPTDIPVRLGV